MFPERRAIAENLGRITLIWNHPYTTDALLYMNSQKADVRVGDAVLSIEKGHHTFIRSIYWAILAASIVVGLYDGSDAVPPWEIATYKWFRCTSTYEMKGSGVPTKPRYQGVRPGTQSRFPR